MTGIKVTSLAEFCELDLEGSNPIIPQDTPTYDGVLSNQVWLQMDQQFRRYSKNSHIFSLTSDLEISKPICSHEAPAHNAVTPYYVWLQKVDSFGKYRPDKIRTKGQRDRDAHTDTWTHIYSYPSVLPLTSFRGSNEHTRSAATSELTYISQKV